MAATAESTIPHIRKYYTNGRELFYVLKIKPAEGLLLVEDCSRTREYEEPQWMTDQLFQKAKLRLVTPNA